MIELSKQMQDNKEGNWFKMALSAHNLRMFEAFGNFIVHNFEKDHLQSKEPFVLNYWLVR